MSSTTIETDAIYKGRHYALAILVVIYTFNFIDRQSTDLDSTFFTQYCDGAFKIFRIC